MAQFTARIEDAEAARQAAERAGAWDYANQAELLRATVLLLQGRPDDAEAIFMRVGPELRFSRPASSAPWVDAAEAFLHLHRGDLEETRRLLHEPGASQDARRAGRVADRATALGWLAWEEDRWEAAAEHLADSRDYWVGGWQLMVGAPCACRCTSTRSCGSAGRTVPRPSSRRRRLASASRPGSSPRRWPRPGSGWARQPSGPPWPSRCRPRRPGRGLARWSGAGAASCSRPPAAEVARATFERIFADLGVQRAERILRRLGAWSPPGADAAGPLSPRELEVAGLVAEGLSNPAIAQRLYLSRPTVAHHVAHILTKLGFASRAQIAAWVAQQRGGGGA